MTRTTDSSETRPVAPLRILIVDNQRARRAELAEAIRGRFTATTEFDFADDGAQAIERLRKAPRECLIVAAELPDVAAIEVLDRAATEFPRLALVLVSDDEDAEIQSSALRRGKAQRVAQRHATASELESAIRRARERVTETGWNRGLVRDLRKTSDEMNHFVRSLSHDMTANFMLLEDSFQQLKQSYDGPQKTDLGDSIRHVEACLQESKRFLEDLVRLGRTGTIEMESARVELSRLAADVVFEQRDALAAAGIDVTVAAGLPAAWCNAKRAKQVLTNLVRNAIKHGRPAAGATLRIGPAEAAYADGADGFAWIEVADNGPGIPAQLAEEIFLPGRRGPTPDETGTGMGLAIVKKIVDHYGGSVAVHRASADGGAAFVFSLRLATAGGTPEPKLPRIEPSLGRIPEPR